MTTGENGCAQGDRQHIYSSEYRLPYRQASTFKGLVLFYRTTTNFTVRHIGLGVYYFVLYSARRPARADVCAFLSKVCSL